MINIYSGQPSAEPRYPPQALPSVCHPPTSSASHARLPARAAEGTLVTSQYRALYFLRTPVTQISFVFLILFIYIIILCFIYYYYYFMFDFYYFMIYFYYFIFIILCFIFQQGIY